MKVATSLGLSALCTVMSAWLYVETGKKPWVALLLTLISSFSAASGGLLVLSRWDNQLRRWGIRQ